MADTTPPAYGDGSQQDAYVDNNDGSSFQPKAAPTQPAGGSGGSQSTGLNMETLKRIYTSVEGILRLVETLCVVIAFGATDDGVRFGSFRASVGEADFVIAINVMAFMWLLFLHPAYIFNLHAKFSWLNLAEFAADAFFAFFCTIAGIALAAKCDGNCTDKLNGGTAFSFISGFLFMGSAFFSFKKWRQG